MRWHGGANGKRGRRPRYSEAAIQFCLTIKSLFNLPLRQAMGMTQRLLRLAGLDWQTPDFSTVSRRQKHLAAMIGAHPTTTGLHLLVDCTCIKMLGEGGWKTKKRGADYRRQWRKVHLDIDATTLENPGHRTAYEFDRDGKPLKRIDARGGVLEYRYDTARRIAELINENGDVHRFVYDALDRLAEETSFDARVTRYRYDDSGLIVGKDELGCAPRTELTPIATTYVRDALGQLTEKVISRVTGAAQAQQMRLRFAYDALGA